MFPSFLLAKLYVKGSLKNNENGFEFQLKNIIDSTMLMGIGPVVTGGKTFEGASITMIAGDKTFNGAELSRENTVPVRAGLPMTIKIQGEPLAVGPQSLSISATTTDIGKIRFDIKDNIA